MTPESRPYRSEYKRRWRIRPVPAWKGSMGVRGRARVAPRQRLSLTHYWPSFRESGEESIGYRILPKGVPTNGDARATFTRSGVKGSSDAPAGRGCERIGDGRRRRPLRGLA